MTGAPLTSRQRAALVLLADGAEHDRHKLAVQLDSSLRGAAITGASLVRRGLAVSRRTIKTGTCYRITNAGLARLRFDNLELIP